MLWLLPFLYHSTLWSVWAFDLLTREDSLPQADRRTLQKWLEQSRMRQKVSSNGKLCQFASQFGSTRTGSLTFSLRDPLKNRQESSLSKRKIYDTTQTSNIWGANYSQSEYELPDVDQLLLILVDVNITSFLVYLCRQLICNKSNEHATQT